MQFFLNFFREQTTESMTRLCTFIVCVSCCGLSWYSTMQGKNNDTLILGMLAMVLTAKVTQKNKEE
jgi:hypothetical protein